MKRALLALCLTGAIVYAPTVASSQSLEAASTKCEQAEVHSVVVDMPQVISLPPASPEAWDSFWDTLPPPVQLDEQPPATTSQAAQTSPDPNEIELLSQLGGQDT
jgi:hypothetical protein